MLRDLLKNVDLKGFEPDVRILLTKYSNSNGSQSPWMEEQIRDAWGSMVLKNVVRETDEVGKGQIRMRTVFEQAIDQRSSTGAWRNALSIWEPVCNEIFDRLIKPMKRAPVIPKHTIKTQPLEDTPSSAPAAPMVDSLIARVGAMARGNAITLPVCGRDVKFTLEVLRGDSVEKTSRVWSGNERDQELLTEDALDDLIPSFLLTGQQTPAFGRRVSGVIEIADGSRRRKAAALTESDYRVLVGELDDEQMAALSRLGNDYRPTSAYERGQRYASRLQNEFAGNISALADAENISRKIITRCINTAKLPKSVVALFSHPGELSARSGDALQRAFTDKEELLKQQASNLHEQKKAGVIFEAEEVITLLTSVLKTSSASRTSLSSRHQFAPGATVLYKGDKMVLNLDRSRIPTECIERIEAILKELEKAAL